MSHPAVLPPELQVPSLVVLALFLAWVVRLIRSHRLSVRDSLLWLLTTALALVGTAFPSLLVGAAELVGVQVPANAVFGVGLLYLALNVLSVTLLASQSADRVRRLAQECALLRAELDAVRARLPPTPGPTPPPAPPRGP
ncbi:MAG TPA: DUF2304 domain-containing protein [Anaeromyxobacter sp.]|nr:DUF2304 domain-containing protein [Anaeromyxobacter sp.]